VGRYGNRGTVMESFTFGWPRMWMLRGLARNDLLHLSDRIESFATMLVMLIAVLAIPVAAAVGTAAHERSAVANADYAESLHQTEATVIGDGRPKPVPMYKVVYSTQVRWDGNGRDHIATIEWPEPVRTGDHVLVWLDESGELTGGPPPADQAGRDGVGIAIMLWTAVAALSAGALQLLRWRLDVARFARWDRELDALADDGSRH